MSYMAQELRHIRRPIENSVIPELKIDIFALEIAVKNLPKKERETLEKSLGLLPGTARKYKNSSKKGFNDISRQNMENATLEIFEKLLSIEYLYSFDSNFRSFVENFASKLDKTGVEDISDIAAKLDKTGVEDISDIDAKLDKTGVEYISDIDAMKYILILLVFIAGGPQLGVTSPLSSEKEKNGQFDHYALLNATWTERAHTFPEHSINLKLLIEIIDMFDIKDVITMKRYVGLPIPKTYSDVQTPDLESFFSIRQFKEKLFKYGAWEITTAFIYNKAAISHINLKKFYGRINTLHRNWEKLSECKSYDFSLETTEGVRKLTVYKLAGAEFTDPYEIQCLDCLKNLL